MRDNITREVCMWRRSRRIYARHCNIMNIGRGTTTTARKKDIKAINNLSFVFYMSMQDLAGGSAWFGAVSLSISCKQSSKTLPAYGKKEILDNDKRSKPNARTDVDIVLRARFNPCAVHLLGQLLSILGVNLTPVKQSTNQRPST